MLYYYDFFYLWYLFIGMNDCLSGFIFLFFWMVMLVMLSGIILIIFGGVEMDLLGFFFELFFLNLLVFVFVVSGTSVKEVSVLLNFSFIFMFMFMLLLFMIFN